MVLATPVGWALPGAKAEGLLGEEVEEEGEASEDVGGRGGALPPETGGRLLVAAAGALDAGAWWLGDEIMSEVAELGADL